MKSLHKKIGSVVLAGALLMGVGVFSNASVAHASSNFQGLLSKVPQSHKHKIDDIGSIISGGGGIYKVINIYGPGNNLAGGKDFNNYSIKKIYDDFIDLLKEAKKEGGAEKLGFKRGYYYQLDFYDLKILIYVW